VSPCSIRPYRRCRPQRAIPVEAVAPNPRNPRAVFSEQAINELATSLKEEGQLQPILVLVLGGEVPSSEPEGPRYESIAGERRWCAARRAGLETVQAAVWQASDEESLRIALLESWHREELTPAEEVAGLEALAETAGETGVRELARRLRVTPSTVSERLKVRRRGPKCSTVEHPSPGGGRPRLPRGAPRRSPPRWTGACSVDLLALGGAPRAPGLGCRCHGAMPGASHRPRLARDRRRRGGAPPPTGNKKRGSFRVRGGGGGGGAHPPPPPPTRNGYPCCSPPSAWPSSHPTSSSTSRISRAIDARTWSASVVWSTRISSRSVDGSAARAAAGSVGSASRG
jgi:ParB/RepB/Spo0J family partition protein